MKKLKMLLVLTALLFSCAAQAKLNGKNVVLIHSFHRLDANKLPHAQELSELANQYWGKYWADKAEAIFHYPLAERVTGGIKDSIRDQIKVLEADGTCREGCVFVTHGLGDLVLRDALSRFYQWRVDPAQLTVLMALDFAGGGGGTEMADIMFTAAEGNSVGRKKKKAIKAFSGIRAEDWTLENLGAFTDLRPATARDIAKQNIQVPRLRFAGTGKLYKGATKDFITGKSDGVVPLHSACGADESDEYESCSQSIKPNGKKIKVSGPKLLLFNHYPVLMGEKTNHEDAISNEGSGNLTTVINNITLGGIDVDFKTVTKLKLWSWFKRVRLVRDGRKKSMSANVYDTLNK